MAILAVQLFNHSFGPSLEQRSLRPFDGHQLHRFLTGEVRVQSGVRADAPFQRPSRAMRLADGRAEVGVAEFAPTVELFVDVEIVLQPAVRPLEPRPLTFSAPSTPLSIQVRLDLRDPGRVVSVPIPGPPESLLGQPHPRLILETDTSRRGMQTVWVDATLIDVTEPLRALQIRADATGARRIADRLKPLKREFTNGTEDVSHRFGVHTRVLEYTAGPPSAWAVMIPLAYRADLPSVGYLVFYRPEIGHYSMPPYVDLERVFRYWRVPPIGFPWFIGPQPEPGWGPTDPMPPIVATPNPCGWLSQLAQAHTALAARGRQAPICVNPIPDGSQYGLAGTFTGLRQMLRALTRALKADGHVGPRVDERPARVAVSGFSAGGDALFGTLADYLAHRGVPDSGIAEMYCHDPNGFSAAQGQLANWFRSDPDRRLRLFAGNQQDSMRVFLRQLGPPTAGGARASLHPLAASFWTGRLYRDALAEPVHTRPNRTSSQKYRDDPPDGFRTTTITVDGAQHQWAVGGGEGSSLRGAGFTGYLEMALVQSGF